MQATNRKRGHAIVKKAENEALTSDMKRCAERIWNAISKYVTVDNEAIFKDKNWPYY
jgi:hypothetical protein